MNFDSLISQMQKKRNNIISDIVPLFDLFTVSSLYLPHQILHSNLTQLTRTSIFHLRPAFQESWGVFFQGVDLYLQFLWEIKVTQADLYRLAGVVAVGEHLAIPENFDFVSAEVQREDRIPPGSWRGYFQVVDP